MDNLTLGPIETIPYAQGSEEWIAERAKPGTCCASEAAAALGVSPHMKRDELIAKMAMGHEKEFSDYVRERVLARGHTSERAAREHLEEELGELAPLTLARTVNGMRWLASLDGQTMDEESTFEHKDWSQDLVAALQRGEVPIDKACQMEHQLIVSDSQQVHFVCSDGTKENRIRLVYRSNPELRPRVVAAWEQLLKDVAAYAPAPAAPVEAVAKTITALPALSLQVKGEIVASNLSAYKPQALAYIAAINTVLEDDQQFADAKADAEFCRDSADKLELVIEQALSQMVDFNAAIGVVREVAEAFDKKALALEKKITEQNKLIKEAEITRGRTALQAHILDLNQQLGKPYMPAIDNDFVHAAKSVRTIESLRNRINTHLADCKIVANERFGVINKNLTWLRENARDYTGLFQHDTATIVLKAHDDLVALATLRINEHKVAEAKKEAETRERIRKEEADLAEQKTAETNRMRMSEISGIQQQVMIASLGRAGVRKGGTIECIRETLAETEGWRIEESNFGPLTPLAQGAKDNAVADIRALLVEAEDAQARQAAQAATPAPTPTPAPIVQPAPVSQATDMHPSSYGYLPLTTAQASSPAANVVPMQRAAPASPPSLKLGEINTRLQYFATTEAGLAALGFPATKVKGACLYHEADWSRMLDSIVAHARMLQHLQQAA